MDALSRYKRHMMLQGKADLTVYNHMLTLNRLRNYLGTPLTSATPDVLYEWRAALGVADSTVNIYLSHVRLFYGWAVEQGLISASPATRLPVPRPPRSLPRPMPNASLLHALDNAAQPIRCWIVLAAWCGMRCKEIALLRAECVRLDEDRPYLIIAADATKGRTEHHIPLFPFAAAELAVHGIPSSGRVFRRPDGRAYRAYDVSKKGNDYLHRLGIAHPMHSLRHWFGTEATERSGGDIQGVAEIMGHAHIQSTAGYSLVRGTRTARIVSQLPEPGDMRRAGLAA